MRRREFITLLGGTVAEWPLMARAQSGIPLIGFLSSLSPAESAHLVAGFRHGLSKTEFVEGRNVAIEYRQLSFDACIIRIDQNSDRAAAGNNLAKQPESFPL